MAGIGSGAIGEFAVGQSAVGLGGTDQLLVGPSRFRKPAQFSQLGIDRSMPLAVGLRSVFLFEDRRFTDLGFDGRRITRRGVITTGRGSFGGQVRSALSGTTGAAATPCLILAPEDPPTSVLTLSAMVHFGGTGPVAGPYNALGGGIASDDTGRMPLFVSVAAGSFRTHVPADNEFLSGGQRLLAASLSGWRRVTVTVSGSAATLYVDGGDTWVGTATQAFANFSVRALLGSDVNAGTEWPWPISDLFYWSRALSADEVAAHERRPYGVLTNKLADLWLGPPGSVTPPIETGNPWDDVFSDEFGTSISYGVLIQMTGAGSLAASASVHKAAAATGAAQMNGGGFLHVDGRVRQPARATFAASGALQADATWLGPPPDYVGRGAGSLAAAPRAIPSGGTTLWGAGSIRTNVTMNAGALTAQRGFGRLLSTATFVLSKDRGEMTAVGVGGFSATANVHNAPLPLSVVLAGSGRLAVNAIAKAAPRSKINGYGRLVAKAHVRKRKRMLPGIANGVAPEIIALEIETYVPSVVAVTYTPGHGTRAHGTLSRTPPTQLEKTGMITASDIGYRTSPADQGGPASYPPLLNDAYQIDVALALEPAKTAAAAAWGSILLANPNHQFDTMAATQNAEGRSVRILKGAKAWDADRQYFTDPRYSALTQFFSALGAPWSLTDDGLQIPLRDVSYYLEKPLQGDYYGGTGGLDGTPDLAGKPKPIARGGSSTTPIKNVTATLVDPAPPPPAAGGPIYQYSDGPGQIFALYEGGATGAGAITLAGDTTNLYNITTPFPGRYYTDNSRGLFQLGSPPTGQITVDVVGLFPQRGAASNPFQIMQYLLTDDAALPVSMLDIESFTSLQADHPTYVSGLYFGSDEVWSCIQAIDSALASLGANLVPTRDGRLRLTLLRAISSSERAVATYDESQIVSITRRALPQTLDPPPYRFRIGYNHNYTVMTSGINASLATAARQQFMVSADRFAGWYDSSLLAAYRRPNDYDAMPGSLLLTPGLSATQSASQEVANELGALWGTKRRLYDVTVPRSLFGSEIGDVVHLRYPIETLIGGQDGRVVGYSLRATDAVVVYTVLV